MRFASLLLMIAATVVTACASGEDPASLPPCGPEDASNIAFSPDDVWAENFGSGATPAPGPTPASGFRIAANESSPPRGLVVDFISLDASAPLVACIEGSAIGGTFSGGSGSADVAAALLEIEHASDLGSGVTEVSGRLHATWVASGSAFSRVDGFDLSVGRIKAILADQAPLARRFRG